MSDDIVKAGGITWPSTETRTRGVPWPTIEMRLEMFHMEDADKDEGVQ